MRYSKASSSFTLPPSKIMYLQNYSQPDHYWLTKSSPKLNLFSVALEPYQNLLQNRHSHLLWKKAEYKFLFSGLFLKIYLKQLGLLEFSKNNYYCSKHSFFIKIFEKYHFFNNWVMYLKLTATCIIVIMQIEIARILRRFSQ